ncbi:MAG: hypothetical protein FJX74_26330, partial [Armatimonadetes bacterium]|nr:hypothetical protein [Armatimonadota bacterium]
MNRSFMRPTVAAITLLCLWIPPLGGQQPRRVRFQDLPAGWSESEASFGSMLADIEKRTRARLLEGENEHLIAYILQSARFTDQPKIEPALSAMEYMAGGTPAGRIPPAVAR